MTSWNFGRLIAAFAVTLIGCGFCFAGDGGAAEYVEGTIDAVPPHTAGALDLKSPEVLVLKFGDWRNTIPYEQITGAQWGRPHDGGWKEHITAPLSRLLSKPKYLTLEFRGGTGQQTERAVFRMAPKVAASLSPVLSARTAGTPAGAQRRPGRQVGGTRVVG